MTEIRPLLVDKYQGLELKTIIRTGREHAFVIRLPDLRKLWELLEEHIGTVEASAVCSDDIEREFDVLEQLSSYDNPPTKEIFRLSIISQSKDGKKSAHVRACLH